jgi:Archaeal fructose-1,6-bisphosphatase and related enzymes of inositol monophosphatase family
MKLSFRPFKVWRAYLNNTRIRVSKKSEFKNAFLVTGGPRFVSKKRDDIFEEFKKISNIIKPPIRKSGSAALDLAYVAAGRYDGAWQRELNYWDIAAGIIILKEAGGYIENLVGNKFDKTSLDIVATNSKIHKELCNLL